MKLTAPLLVLLTGIVVSLPAQTCPGPATHLVFTALQQDHVRIPNPASGALDGFANFTIECWVKVSAGAGLDTLVSKWRQLTPNQTPYLLRLYSGAVQFGFSNGFLFSGPTVVNNGVWHHVAVTRIGSTVQIVVDGVVDATTSYAPLVHTMNGPVVLGCFLDATDTPTPSTFLNGSLDEVRIWNIGRTVAQIQATKNQAIAPVTPGLVGYWRLDAGSGQTVVDASPSAAHGVLGDTSAVATNDPAWNPAGGPVLGYPCGSTGVGNANSALATLLVNGFGAAPLTGPFAVQLTPGATLTFNWAGPAGKPLALLAGAYNPGNANIPGLGIIDIGTPPGYPDLYVLFNGSQFPNALFYTLGSGGTATQSFTLPPSLSAGPLLTVQGAVFQPAGTTPYGLVLTAAFQLNG